MTSVYVDSSVLVKLYVREEGAEFIADYFDAHPILTSSLLTYVEVLAVLNRHRRDRRIPAPLFWEAREQLDRHFAALVCYPLEIARSQYQQLCYDHRLKGADSVHLALALAANKHNPTEMATYDKALAREARAAGLMVWSLFD